MLREGTQSPKTQFMTGGGLETAKQSAFHVELIGREIATP